MPLEAGGIVVLPRGDAHELWNGPVSELTDTSSSLPKILGGAIVSERGGGSGPKTKFICGYIGCERYAKRLFLVGLPPVFKTNVRRQASGEWIEISILRGRSQPQRARGRAVR